jgi:hypothetical protein
MSILLKDQWRDWARDWGLAHHPEKGWMRRTEWMAGEHNGLLVRVGWGTEGDPGFVVLIRFPRVGDVDRLRQALIDDETLDALPGKGAARRRIVIESGPKKAVRLGSVPEFSLTENSLVWRRVFRFSTPKAGQLQSWVDALIVAVTRTTPRFDGRCEVCATGAATRYVLVNEVPMMMCATCQQRLSAEGEMAERTYEMTEARHLPGLALGLVAALGGAVAWAAIEVLTNRIFAAAAVGIGALVAWTYKRGAGRVDAAGRVIAGGLTLVSVVLGEIMIYAWMVMKARPEIGFNLEAGWYVYVKMWGDSPGSEAITILFALVGAWVAAKALERPQLRARIEAGETTSGQSKAA